MSGAYEPCSRCGGYGIVDRMDGPTDCPKCRGDCYIRARDRRGRFVNLDRPDAEPEARRVAVAEHNQHRNPK